MILFLDAFLSHSEERAACHQSITFVKRLSYHVGQHSPTWSSGCDMGQDSSFRLQLTCPDLNESSLQAMTRDVTKSLRDHNVGRAIVAETVTHGGTKGDPITIGSIVLALLGSGGVAVSLVQVLKAYVERKRTLQFELTRPDGRKLNFTAENLADKDLLQHATKVMEEFIAS